MKYRRPSQKGTAVFIRYDPDEWRPTSFRDTGLCDTQKLPVGQLVIWERTAHRVVEVREREQTDWPQGYRDLWVEHGMPDPATWYGRPMVIVLQPEDQPAAKPRHLQGRAGASWRTLVEHYSVCRLCQEIPPCRHEHTEKIMDRAQEHMNQQMAIMPGCCHSCQEPITRRQKAVTFTGANLIRPDLGDDSAIFHQRQQCFGDVRQYDERWAAAEPGRKRRFYCEGHRTHHHDDTVDCTEMAECVGDVEHRSTTWHRPYVRYEQSCWCLTGDQAEQLDRPQPSRDSLF
jgi:hypothetical protein